MTSIHSTGEPSTVDSTDESTATPAPRVLESWAATLSFLQPQVAQGIEHLAKRIGIAMDEQHSAVAGNQEPNGYSGIAQRGDLKRMLLSDWALSEIEPDEFLRRLVSSELSYLDIERVEPQPPGQTTVIFDAGPQQAGAPRIAQLAALVVLYRRSLAGGVPLVIGSLTEAPSKWYSGQLPEIFESWRRARTSRAPQQNDINRRLTDILPDTALWVFGAADLTVERSDLVVERFNSVESSWGPEGATALRVDVSGRTLELDLPEPATSTRVIRGHGLRRSSGTDQPGAEYALRFPSFHGSARRLVCRTDRDDELVSFTIPATREAPGGKPKRQNFNGPVLAASPVGQRLVAMVANGDSLQFEVVGKKLGNVNNIDLDRHRFGLDDNTIDELTSTSLAPLFFRSGEVLVQIKGTWWGFHPQEEPREYPVMQTCHATSTVDNPLILSQRDLLRWVAYQRFEISHQEHRTLLGPGKSHITEIAPGVWSTSTGKMPLPGARNLPPGTIEVDPDARIIALTSVQLEPVLIEHSAGGQLIRLHRPSGTSTLTKFSGDVQNIAVHPTIPLLAIQRSDGVIIVVDLETMDLLHRIRGRVL